MLIAGWHRRLASAHGSNAETSKVGIGKMPAPPARLNEGSNQQLRRTQ